MILQPGDGVTIIAPAAQLHGGERDLLPQAVTVLESWGLKVAANVDRSHHFYLAGKDEVRAAHLNNALASPETRAIFCMRGGYGCARLLRHLDPTLLPEPKVIVGYSDLTALHAAISRNWPQISLIHGPNVATNQFLSPSAESKKTRDSLREALFSEAYTLNEPVESLRDGTAEGKLIGGCLSLVVSLVGTRFAFDPRGAILFLEDTGEPPYRIDRMLMQLRLAGYFDHVAGVIFGAMHNCKDPYNNLRDVIRDFFADSSFPVAMGLRSGHGQLNLSVRLNDTAMLDSSAGTIAIG